jgi:hypothetical protein
MMSLKREDLGLAHEAICRNADHLASGEWLPAGHLITVPREQLLRIGYRIQTVRRDD